MNVKINGKPEEIEEGSTVLKYLNEKGLTRNHVVIELNKQIVKKDNFSTTVLQKGDTIEIFQLVGGG